MATRTVETTFHCWNDCRLEGCPTHVLRVTSGNTEKGVGIYLDDQLVTLSYQLSNVSGMAALFALLKEIDGFIDLSGHN